MANKYLLIPEELYRGLVENEPQDINLSYEKKVLEKTKKIPKKDSTAKNTLYNQELARYLKLKHEALNKPIKVELTKLGQNLPGAFIGNHTNQNNHIPTPELIPEPQQEQRPPTTARNKKRTTRTLKRPKSFVGRRRTTTSTYIRPEDQSWFEDPLINLNADEEEEDPFRFPTSTTTPKKQEQRPPTTARNKKHTTRTPKRTKSFVGRRRTTTSTYTRPEVQSWFEDPLINLNADEEEEDPFMFPTSTTTPKISPNFRVTLGNNPKIQELYKYISNNPKKFKITHEGRILNVSGLPIPESNLLESVNRLIIPQPGEVSPKGTAMLSSSIKKDPLAKQILEEAKAFEQNQKYNFSNISQNPPKRQHKQPFKAKLW